MNALTHSTKRNSRGAALAELGIILILLLLLVITFTEMGIAYRRANIVLDAARAGARAGGAMSQQVATGCPSSPALIGINTCNNLSPFADNIANSAFNGTCQYLGTENFDPTKWSIKVSYLNRLEEASFTFLRVDINQTNQRNCIVCLGNFLKDYSITASSTFAIQKEGC